MGQDEQKISIIMPVHKIGPLFEAALKKVRAASTPIQLIIVLNNKDLEGKIVPEGKDDLVVLCERQGRGYPIARGLEEVQNDIVVMLHSDTVLPDGWDGLIKKALSDERVAAGGFRLSFDRPTRFLDFCVWLTNVQYSIFNGLWGDRAIFTHAELLRGCKEAMDAPMWEDVRIVKCLRRKGKVISLDQKVVTSADSFHKRGPFRFLMRIIRCRLWYTFGGDLNKIYKSYYAK